MFSKLVPVALLILLILSRFYGLFWGNGFFFQPDENNMAAAVAQFSPQNLNPHFFAYGQSPLYLAYFSLRLLHLPNTFPDSIYVLRFWSALFSVTSVIVFYFISTKIFTPKVYSYLFVLLLIFTPGLIQLAHFGTTESLLILVFALNLLISLYLLSQPQKYSLYLVSGLVTGVGLSAKISALILVAPVLVVFLINLVKTKYILKHLISGFGLTLVAAFIFVFFSPYNLIEFADFLSAIRYETEVANGISPVFYTSQFLHTYPFLFQFVHIFPYTNGLPVYLGFFIGSVLFAVNFKKTKPKLPLVIVLLSSFIYLLYFSTRYVKWTRFCSPVFFLLPLLTVYFFSRIKNKVLLSFFVVVSVIPGITFFKLYLEPDIRVTASVWMANQFTANTKVLSEAGNVMNLPLGSDAQVINFDFFNLDTTPDLQQQLPLLISQSDYILVPSRRVFKNQSTPDFPWSQKYYQSLFSGSLGFIEIKRFSTETSWPLLSENAEETWSVFDHPVIRVYKNISNLTQDEIQKQITP